jgi:maltose-binding protein MalE
MNKKLIFCLLALLICSAAVSAAGRQRSYSAEEYFNTEAECITISANNKAMNWYNCKTAAFYANCDVEVTVSIGAGSTYAKVTVTAKDVDCSKLFQIIKQLKAQARAALA